jgi:hypothetical protein
MSQVLSCGLVSAAEVSVFYEAQLVYRWRQDGFAVAAGNGRDCLWQLTSI